VVLVDATFNPIAFALLDFELAELLNLVSVLVDNPVFFTETKVARLQIVVRFRKLVRSLFMRNGLIEDLISLLV